MDVKPGILVRFKNLLTKFRQEVENRPISDSGILIGTAILVGIGSGFGAVLFTYLVESVQKIAFEDVAHTLQSIHPWHLVIIPMTGALITGPIIYLFCSRSKRTRCA